MAIRKRRKQKFPWPLLAFAILAIAAGWILISRATASRGCTVTDIVNTVAITAIQAQAGKDPHESRHHQLREFVDQVRHV